LVPPALFGCGSPGGRASIYKRLCGLVAKDIQNSPWVSYHHPKTRQLALCDRGEISDVHRKETRMDAIHAAQQIIQSAPGTPAARTLATLIAALEAESQIELASLYTLDIKTFELALAVLDDWRIDRYYAGKAKVFEDSEMAALA